ncbi:hypothetical protein [Candidatus Viridilinea mediisalina]|uniref:Uncharacterized protein n=1 Tax=Candidatus Viridilinea mediisalina TaxID=2024553 RepID=A0A2A6RMZ9_9CHLR|nr:hypothetical protein [Candidatus Viridilinea mediisalina]PDW04258.1 hypothetical protein CJ255_04725 [Candidatus Viridilinea mediisalina]
MARDDFRYQVVQLNHLHQLPLSMPHDQERSRPLGRHVWQSTIYNRTWYWRDYLGHLNPLATALSYG